MIDTRQAPRHTRFCDCGATIWDVAALSRLPSYFERLLCPGCGADHSRHPPLHWRLRYGLRKMRRTRRAYGIRALLKLGLSNAFRLARETTREEKAVGQNTEDPEAAVAGP